ncbi:hypothetical protein FA10DRAFT_240323 [Acaromyces ingoldii]|uniref:Alpha-1,3-glucosyltransferase n=1 Tax=Acaromyces ingoldii TaxID=215250 RepID=A0A316YKA3_9BASI|nr:hypothetical protein FA10DRAFT_240323 [Acaromyces ingoldii]PWN89857.1 hypothetical protein FA10DRAFT_240323 [Acaromyces ingoldii]
MAPRPTRTGLVSQHWQLDVLIVSLAVKLLLIPAYHSTDFEVHRHWLALTHSLPLSQWYFDETSQWTLDYPPFFAHFSWFLSLPAKLVDPKIIDLRNGLGYTGGWCKPYMRLSVIVTEHLSLASALWALSRPSSQSASGTAEQTSPPTPPLVAAAILLHPGLVIVDHIHFQYNGFLFGILFWSIWAAREGRPLLCALLFASLLNFKHIYIYVAPAYFVYLLQTYVLKPPSAGGSGAITGAGERLFTLGTITLMPFALSLMPLLASGLTAEAPAGSFGIVKQMVSRLFPFSRGLNHAYWAANFWALYTFADRVLIKLVGVMAWADDENAQVSASRGIIGDTVFGVLPQITAGHCFLLTLAFTVVFSARLWFRPTYHSFVESIGLFGLTSFLYGFHVHEKAVLVGLLPLTLLASLDYRLARSILVLSLSGIVGLFPLLYEARETPIKVAYTLLWTIIFFSGLGRAVYRPVPTNVGVFVAHWLEEAYLVGFVALQVFVSVGHPLLVGYLASSSPSLLSKTEEHAQALVSSIVAAASSSSSSVSALAASASAAATAAPSPTEEASNAASSVLSSLSSIAAPLASSASSSGFLATAISVARLASPKQPPSPAIPVPEPSSANLEFLPLMLTSVYCAIGVLWAWFVLGIRYLLAPATEEEKSEDAAAPTRKGVPVNVLPPSPEKTRK